MIEQVEYLSDLVNDACDRWIDGLNSSRDQLVKIPTTDGADDRR